MGSVSQQKFGCACAAMALCVVDVAFTCSMWVKKKQSNAAEKTIWCRKAATHTHHMSHRQEEQTSKHHHLASIHPDCFSVVTKHNPAHPGLKT